MQSAESALADGFEFTLDRGWRITSITDSAAAWAGSTAEELLGRDGHDINPASTRLLAKPVEAAIKGATSRLEHPSTHVPGRWVRVEVGPFRGGARIRFEDITPEVAARDAPEPPDEAAPFGAGPAEIVLLNRRGVIVATNAAWRAGIAAQGISQPDAGVGMRYAAVAKVVVPRTDEPTFESRLEELFVGRVAMFEATFSQKTPEGGLTRRQVRITPLQINDDTYFVALHEDLTERARVLAALHETTDQLLYAQEKERQRIAIELHDSTSQHLAGLILSLGSLRRRVRGDATALALIEEMDKLAQQATQETRVLAYLLNASSQAPPEGLEASARRFVEGFGRRTGLRTTFEATGPIDAVSAAAQHAVFRVVQEALSNVYRHARAKTVSVSLISSGGSLTARIADNGKGLPAMPRAEDGAPPLGVGVPGMRARIEQLGGTLTIENSGGGAVVTATIPLRSQRRA